MPSMATLSEVIGRESARINRYTLMASRIVMQKLIRSPLSGGVMKLRMTRSAITTQGNIWYITWYNDFRSKWNVYVTSEKGWLQQSYTLSTASIVTSSRVQSPLSINFSNGESCSKEFGNQLLKVSLLFLLLFQLNFALELSLRMVN